MNAFRSVYLAFLTLCVSALIGCSPKTNLIPLSIVASEMTVDSTSIDTSFPDTISSDSIRAKINGLSNNLPIEGTYLEAASLIHNLYDSLNPKLIWNTPEKQRKALGVLYGATNNGLIPEDYHVDIIENLYFNQSNINHIKRIDYDILISDGILVYAYHLLRGKLDSETLEPTIEDIESHFPDQVFYMITKAIESEDLELLFEVMEPSSDEYQMLKTKLREINQMVQDGGWNTLSYVKTIRPGEANPQVAQIRTRLQSENLYSFDRVVDENIFDTDLQESVKRFQYLHGLKPDGIIGKGTVKMMNISARQKRMMVIANLERLRWVDFQGLSIYIRVNIASFFLQLIEKDSVIWTQPIMVGTEQTQTPTFSSVLRSITLNPTWTIPRSIATTETLEKLKRDSNYLEKNNLIVLNTEGQQLKSDTVINWSKYHENYFPFVIRQQPGSLNALGRVKFSMPNIHSIFIHDTPSKYLFSKERRAFSHGCIRLQKPMELANYILAKEPGNWNELKTDSIIHTLETTTIRLNTLYPVEIIYQTVELDSDCEVRFYEDVYNRDENLYHKIQLSANRGE
jgi:murein L,D-transpeptidase YcbB/YkuD